jgi:putative inorganic carbon (HCO3(-)) transporter
MAKIEIQDSLIQKILKSIIWICTIMSLFVPFIVDNNAFFPFVGAKSLYFMGFAEIIFCSWLILAIIDPRYRPKVNKIMIAVFIYLIVFGLATAFSLEPSRSFWSKFERMTGLLMQLHLVGYFLAISNTFKEKKNWNILFLISTSFSALMSVYFLCSKYGINIFDKLLKYSSWGGMTIGNSSFLATYLLFNVFLCIYLIINFWGMDKKIFDWEQAKRNIFLVGAGFIVVVPFCIWLLKNTGVYFSVFLILLTVGLLALSFFPHIGYLLLIFVVNLCAFAQSGGRAALAAFFGGLVLIILFYFAFAHKSKNYNKFGKIALVVFAIGSTLFLLSIVQSGSYLNKEFIKSGGGARTLIWNKVLQAVKDRPILGYGPENFELVFYKYFDARLHMTEWGGEAWFDRSHNIVIDTLLSTGILGLITYLGIFGAVAYFLWKKSREDKTYFWDFAVISGMLAAYFVQNLTVFDMISSYMMFFTVLGFANALEGIGTKDEEYLEKDFNFVQILSFFVVVIMLFIWMNNFIIGPYKSDVAVVSAIQEHNPATRIELMKEGMVSKVGVYQIRDYLSEAIDSLMQSGQLTPQQKEAYKPEADFFIAQHKQTILEAPDDYRAYIRLGYLMCSYTMAYDKTMAQEALGIFQKAVELSPDNPQSYWGLAHANFFTGNANGTLQAIDKAVQLEPLLTKTYRMGISYALALRNNAYVKKYAQAGWDASFKHMDNIPGVQAFYDDAIYFGGLLGKKDEIFTVIDRAIKDSDSQLIGFFKAGLEFAKLNNRKDKFTEYATNCIPAVETKINNPLIDKTKDDFDIGVLCAGSLGDKTKMAEFINKAIAYDPTWKADYEKLISTSSQVLPPKSK